MKKETKQSGGNADSHHRLVLPFRLVGRNYREDDESIDIISEVGITADRSEESHVLDKAFASIISEGVKSGKIKLEKDYDLIRLERGEVVPRKTG